MKQHLVFLREFARCGIFHNYSNDETQLNEKLKTMEDALNLLDVESYKNRLKSALRDGGFKNTYHTRSFYDLIDKV